MCVLCLWRSEEGIESCRTGVIDNCKALCVRSPWEEQPEFLTDEPILKPKIDRLIDKFKDLFIYF